MRLLGSNLTTTVLARRGPFDPANRANNRTTRQMRRGHPAKATRIRVHSPAARFKTSRGPLQKQPYTDTRQANRCELCRCVALDVKLLP